MKRGSERYKHRQRDRESEIVSERETETRKKYRRCIDKLTHTQPTALPSTNLQTS